MHCHRHRQCRLPGLWWRHLSRTESAVRKWHVPRSEYHDRTRHVLRRQRPVRQLHPRWRRGWRAVIAVLIAIFVRTPDPLSLESLRLPETLHATAVCFQQGVQEPVAQWEVVESATSVHARQDWAEGGVGFVPLALTVADADCSLVYDIRTRRGLRDHRFWDSGTTRVDGLVTPMAWVRLNQFAIANGDEIIQTTNEAGETVVIVNAPPITGRSFCAILQPSTGELRRVTRGEGAKAIVFTYDDWRDIGDNNRAPFLVSYHIPGNESRSPIDQNYLIGVAERADPTHTRRAFTVPAQAMIEDRRESTLSITDGTGKSVLAESPPPLSPVPPAGQEVSHSTKFTPKFILLSAGGGLILAALVLRISRALRASAQVDSIRR